MKKSLLTLIIISSLISAASTEQITQYLSLSHSEQEVLAVEQVFDSMRQKQKSNESNESTSQTAIVYQEYLEEHLSSLELEEILALYRLPTMSRYTSEVKNFEINQEDMDAFLESLKEEPLSSEREELVDTIVKNIINEELQLNFYRSMMQRYQSRENNNSKEPTTREKRYVDAMRSAAKNHLLYGTQVFSMEEMKELKDSLSSAIFQKVKRVENEALIQIMNNYIKGVVSKPKKLSKSYIK